MNTVGQREILTQQRVCLFYPLRFPNGTLLTSVDGHITPCS